jgi:hypothetical protein
MTITGLDQWPAWKLTARNIPKPVKVAIRTKDKVARSLMSY